MPLTETQRPAIATSRPTLVQAGALFATLLTFSSPLLAQAPNASVDDGKAVGGSAGEDELEFELDTFVVTATRSERDVAAAPASVSVVSKEELLKAPVGDLSDAIRNVEGINIVAGTQGRREISIRGMDSSHTLILIDGKRVNSREAVFRHNDFDVSQIPVESIERIEVVRGSMSSLYGSEALGGVINIITKKVPDRWTGSVDVKAQTPTHGVGGQEGRVSVYAGGPLVKDRLGLRITGAFDQRRIWHGEPDRGSQVFFENGNPVLRDPEDPSSVVRRGELASLEGRADHGGKARLVWTPDDKQTIAAEYGRGFQTRAGDYFIGNSFGTATNEVHRNDVILSHDGKWGWGTSTVRTYWEGIESSNDGLVQDNLVLEGNAALALGSHLLTLGGEARWTGLEAPGTFTSGSASVHQEAIYAQDEWEISKMLTVLVGARLDHHQNFGLWPTPRGYVVFSPVKPLTLKGGVGTGFRAPTLRQLSNESSVVSCRGACLVDGNPDLQPEKSINYELSAAWNERRFGASVTVFQNDVSNLVDTPRGEGVEPLRIQDGLPVFGPKNVKKARMRGVEAGGYFRFLDVVRLSANYTLLDARDLDENVELDNKPAHLVNGQVDWEVVDSVSLFGRGQYVGSQKSGTERIPGYLLVDAGVSWEALKNLSVTAGVLNVANSRTISESGYAYQERGRTAYVGLNGRL